jgi:hypothetical protein
VVCIWSLVGQSLAYMPRTELAAAVSRRAKVRSARVGELVSRSSAPRPRRTSEASVPSPLALLPFPVFILPGLVHRREFG